MTTDPIADMLTRIRNAVAAGHESVEVAHSKMKAEICRVLKECGYIEDYSVLDRLYGGQGALVIYPKYLGPKRPVIAGLERVSKPGRRVYVGKHEIPRVMRGLGIAILSTNKGILTDQQARKMGVGGELLLKVW